MACYNSWFDLVSYGNKVILTSTPLVGSRYTLRVHVWDIISSSITTLPDWNNGLNYIMSSFATTAYNVYANEYISFLSSNYIPKALKSAAGGAWSDISTGLTGSVDNGSWGCYVVFNNLMSRYTAFASSGTLQGYSWDGTTWSSLNMPSMSSTNTFATSNYKDAYFLAWNSNTQVGIFTPNETPFRNTVNIASTPGTTTCDLLFPDRGVGNKVVVFVKQGTYVAPVTANNTTYTANTAFGSGTQLGSSGWVCVYNGVGQALTITGLTLATTYQVQALEYNGLAGAEMYIGTASLTGNPISFTTTGPPCTNPTSGGTIAAAQTVCSGGTPSPFTSTASPSGETGIIEYKWQLSVTGSSSGFSDIASSNSATYAPGALSVNTWYKRVARVTCKADWTGAAESNVLAVTMNLAGQVNQPADQVVCNNTSTTTVIFSTTNSGGTTTYAWTNTTTGVGLAASGAGNIASFTAVNTGTLPVVATIVVTPTFNNGSVSCAGPTKTFTITVNPTGQVNQPANQVVCNTTSTATVVFGTTNTGGTTTYAWTNDTPGIGLLASGTGNIASFTAVNTGTSPVVATIVVTPTFTNGAVGCAGPTKTFTITVNPTGQVTQPVDQVVCNGAATTVTFATVNTGGTTTYAWANNNPGIGLPPSGTGNISFNAINTGTSPVTATFTVTPTFTNGAVGCAGPSKTFTITVNPTGQVNQPSSQVLCHNTSTNAIVFSTVNSGGTTTYAWTNSAPSIGLPASGSGNILSFTAINTGTVPVIATIVVTPTFTNGSTGCAGPTRTFTITVNPLPVPTITGQTSNICPGSGYTYYSTEYGNSNYIWTISPGEIIVTGQGTAQVEVYWTGSGPQWIAVSYTYPSGCTPAASTQLNLNVIYIPGQAGTITGTDTVCAGTPNVVYSVDTISNATVYLWTLPAGASIVSGSGTNSITVNFASNALSGNITVCGNNICGNGAVSTPFAVMVNPIPPRPAVTANGYTLTSSASNGNQWYHNGNAVAGATQQVYIVPATDPGHYWTIVTLSECTSDSSNHVYIAGVGIRENKNLSFNVYPVPNNGVFTAEVSSGYSESYHIQIYNTLGVMVYKTEDFRVAGKHEEIIDVSFLPAGIYSVVFKNDQRQIVRKIFINK